MGSSSPTVTKTSNLTAGQKKYLNTLMDYVTPQIGQGVASYSGELTPSANTTQTGEWNLANQMLSGTAPGQAQATSTETALAKAWDPTEATAEWKKAIEAPTLQTWNDTTLPSILEKFAGSNAAGGGNAAKTVTQEATKLQTGLESNLASTLLSDKSTSNAQALTASNQLYSQLQDTLSAASTAGTEKYNVGQAADTAAQKNWSSSQAYNNPWLQLASGGLNTNALTNIVTPGTNYMSALGSGASAAASAVK